MEGIPQPPPKGRSPRKRKSKAGTEEVSKNGHSDSATYNYCSYNDLKFGEMAWITRAERYIMSQYGVQSFELSALSHAWACMAVKGRLNKGIGLTVIVSWSGQRYRFQNRLRYCLGLIIEKGLLESVGVQRGDTLRITPKGLTVLRAWQDRIELYKQNALKR